MKSFMILILIFTLLGCASTPPVPAMSMSNQELLETYYNVCNQSDQYAQDVASYNDQKNFIGSGVSQFRQEQSNKRKAELLLELNSRGINP